MSKIEINDLLSSTFTEKGRAQWWSAYEAADDEKQARMLDSLVRMADGSYS